MCSRSTSSTARWPYAGRMKRFTTLRYSFAVPGLQCSATWLLEIARRHVRHRDCRGGLALRVLATLDAGDGLGRLAPRLVGGDDPMAPECHPLRLAFALV